MQIFVYLTLRRNKTHIYTLCEAHTDVLKGWSTAFIANDKETKWIAKSNIASSRSTTENGCSSCTLTVEKKLYYAFSLLLFPLLSPSLFFLSVSVHHIASTTSQYISFRFHWPMTCNVPICFKYLYLCHSQDLYILIWETVFSPQCLWSTLCRYHQFRKSSHPIYEIVTRYNVMVVMWTSNKLVVLHRLLGEKVF